MFCPVCNGVQSLQTICSSCGSEMTDCGRISDWVGPYAPYEPIEEDQLLSLQLSRTAAEQECCHIVHCEHCRLSSELFIAQWL